MSNTLLLRRRHTGGISPYMFTLVPQAVGGASFTFTQRGTGSLEYSTDGSTWTQFVSGQPTATIAQNTPVLVRGNLQPVESETWTDAGIGTFSASGNFSVSGCPCTLLGEYNIDGDARQYAFVGLFNGCSTIVDASNMIFQRGMCGQSAYRNLFYGCANLILSPQQIPSSVMFANGCKEMFRNCTSLQTAPDILAASIGDRCFENMFMGCSSLQAAPPNLYATYARTRCYSHMFDGCSALVTPPNIAATAMDNNNEMSYMFYQCTSLQTAPEIKITQCVGNSYSFSNMFNGCTALNSIKVHFEYWSPNCTYYWVMNVSSAGTFYKKSVLSATYGDQNIPNGWNVVNF